MIENNSTSGIGGTLGTLLSAYGVTLSITQLQAIISIVVTILGFLLTLTTTVIIPVIKKVKKAKKDGKVTVKELEDIVDTAQDGLNKIKGDKKDE